MNNYYKLLKVKQGATSEKINEVYGKLYIKYNSDGLIKNCSNVEYAMEHALEWIRIKEAYTALSNSISRIEYGKEPRVIQLCYKYQEGAIDKIKGKEHGKLASEMLNVIAYLNPKNIPSVMFLGLTNFNTDLLLSCLELLKPYSLIRYELKQKQLLLSVHEIIQHNTRLMLKTQNMEEEVLDKAVNLLGSTVWDVVPYKLMKSKGIKSETKGVPKIDLFYPHVEHILGYTDKYQELNRKCSELKRVIGGLTRADHLNKTKDLPYKLMFTDEGFSDP